jgi:ATP synthase protein I
VARDDQNIQERFGRQVGRKERRKLRSRRGGDRSIWFWLGMMGLVGWTVSVPTLIGLAIGVWLDSFMAGRISWTLTGLVIGVAAGAAAAWYWVNKESRCR